MRDTLCMFDLDGLHVIVEHVYYQWPVDAPESFVASVLPISSETGYRPTLGQKSFGSQHAAENWILKQLTQSTFVILARKTLD